VISKTQYQEKLRYWGFVKNSRSSDWKIVHHRIQKRKKQDKLSVVYRRGRRVEAKKLNKESRHDYSSVLELFNPSSTQTPIQPIIVNCQPDLLSDVPEDAQRVCHLYTIRQ
jgi:hypothetical protein